MDSSHSRTYRFGPFRFEPRSGELLRDGQRTRLPRQVAAVLEALLARAGQLVTREELRALLWPNGTIVDFDHGVANAVQRLRDALGETAAEPRYVETLPRRGFRFVAVVESSAAASAPGWRRALGWPAVASVLTGLIVLTTLLLRAPGPANTVASDARVRLVVLPFENLTGDDGETYFVAGLTEELITQLGQFAPERLAVVARTSAMRFEGVSDLSQVARELNVDYALEGSVRRQDERIRVSARLVRTSDGMQTWAGSFDRERNRMLDLHQELSQRMAAALSLKVLPQSQTREHMPSTEAREAYLRGKWFWHQKTPQDMSASIRYLQQAVELDPPYARAHAALAASVHSAGAMGVMDSTEARRLTAVSARRALELDPTAGDALAILAESRFRFGGETEGIEPLFRRAAALRPNDSQVLHWFGVFLALTGKVDEALVQLERARHLDPLELHLGSDYADVLYRAGRREQAMRQLARVRELDPSFPKSYLVEAAIALDEERHADAVAALERANELSPATPKYVAALARVYARAGRRAEARRTLGELHTLASRVHVAPDLMRAVEEELRD